jgi:tRNA threonylcarbamoyladenosine biosynthesis protein TsaB
VILAIDTTAEFGSIALCDLDRVIEEVPLHAPDGFAHVVFGELESLLMRHGLRAGDIDRYAAASGPGSFTGVRVGLTLAKGLAFATGKKVVAVSNLQALASFGTAELRAPLIEARRGEVYAAVYDANLELVVPEMVTTFDKFIETLAARGPIEFISATMDPALERGRQIVIAPRALAGAIGKIAARGEGGLPEDIDANYVRRSDAELFWTDR